MVLFVVVVAMCMAASTLLGAYVLAMALFTIVLRALDKAWCKWVL